MEREELAVGGKNSHPRLIFQGQWVRKEEQGSRDRARVQREVATFPGHPPQVTGLSAIISGILIPSCIH